jgi:hypothetical protein
MKSRKHGYGFPCPARFGLNMLACIPTE